MAKVTVLLNIQYASKDGSYPIVVRVTHAGKRRLIPVGYKTSKRFWKDSGVAAKHPDSPLINAAIADKVAEINRYLADCQRHGRPVNIDAIGTVLSSHSFTEYLRHRATQYKAAEQIIMDRKVRRWADEVEQVGAGNVFFDQLTPDFLRRLELQMIEAGNVPNTRSKKFTFLRRFYDHAIREGLAAAPNPFVAHKIVGKPVKKDKLTHKQIQDMEKLNLPAGSLNDARNLFLFSFYTKGQRFEVCVTLTKDKIRDGRIYLLTNKGNEHVSVKIHKRLQAILDQYNDIPGPLVFPWLKEIPADKEKYINQVGSKNALVNLALKAIGGMINAPALTFHTARHSFAYQLKQATDNITVVQDALAHSSQSITQLYLKSLEDERLDSEMEKLYGK